MAFSDLITTAQKYFPKLQIKYKNQSTFMKFLGTLLFFDKSFMTDYCTTLGNTIYVPNENYVKLHPVSGAVVIMHELVHIYDHQRVGTFWFQLLYAMPQIFILPALLLFLLSWKIAVPAIIFFLLPWPAYFRMNYERRAYYSSLYCMKKLGDRLNFDPHLDTQCTSFTGHFVDATYYFMWPFKTIIGDDFAAAAQLVSSGKRPFEEPVFDMLDDLVTKV